MYAWGTGMNGRLGEESDSDIDVSQPEPVQSLKEGFEMGLLKVIDASCGENHSLALVSMMNEYNQLEKSVFVWGANDRRQLGVNEETDEIRIPQKLEPCPFKKDKLVP